jgi:hypothetical protein
MKVTPQLLIPLLLACNLQGIRAQTPVEITPPSLSMKGGKVLIEYELRNSKKSEKFSIRIEVTTESGDPLQATSLSGDIGEGISGGETRKIIWDIETDSIFLDEEIFVEVYALPEKPPEPVIPAEEEQALKGDEPTGEGEPVLEKPSGTAGGKQFNRTALIVQSLAFPGLGLSRLNPGQPHWIRGVAAYGCLGGSIYLNRKAWSSYQQYLDPEDAGDKGDLFDQAYDLQKTSRILGYTALAVWTADLVWTILGTSGMKQGALTGKAEGFSIGTGVEPASNTLLIAMRYRF